LKKLAAFRDTEKKRKDRKHLGKKARLRKWRQEVFGSEEGLQTSDLVPTKSHGIDEADADGEDGGVDIVVTGKKKRRRKNKRQVTGGSIVDS
jgi:protein KRI1